MASGRRSSVSTHTHNVVLSILEGPMKGEKRKTLHGTVKVVKPLVKKAKLLFAPAASAAGAAPAASAAGVATTPVAPAESVDPAAAPAAEDPNEQEMPDEECT